MVQQKLRNPSGGQGSLVNSFGLGHLSPDSIKGSNCSMDQNQIGSYEAPPLGKYQSDWIISHIQKKAVETIIPFF